MLSVMSDEGGVPIPRNLDLTGVGVTQDQVVDGVDQVARDWRRERPDIDVSSIGIVTRIWRIARHLENQRREQLAGLGTDRGTMDVLAMLETVWAALPPVRR